MGDETKKDARFDPFDPVKAARFVAGAVSAGMAHEAAIDLLRNLKRDMRENAARLGITLKSNGKPV